MKVLVVDDEAPILEAVSYNLRKEGFETITADDAESCMRMFRTHQPDLIILDVMLPSGSGLEICHRIRAEHETPIIMLTARVAETDRVIGLELGADDYVTKPFGMRELMARVKSVLRRGSRGTSKEPTGRIEVADIIIDEPRHTVVVRGNKVSLSPKEFALLLLLAQHPEQVFSRPTLLDRVWGMNAFVEERTVDVHIRWLREKVEEDASNPKRLVTVRGVGYKLSVDE